MILFREKKIIGDVRMKEEKDNQKKLLKFEFPNKIYNRIEYYNEEKFHQRYIDEYNNRMIFLDLSLSIEQVLSDIISIAIRMDNENRDFFLEEMIINRLDFRDKQEIIKNIFRENYWLVILNYKKIDEKNISIGKFNININKFIKVIEVIRNIRNHITHKSRILYTKDGKIVRSSRNKIFDYKEYDREEVLIKGHFVLWLLYNLKRSSNLIDMIELINYYKKYQEVLSGIATLET